MRLLMLDNEFPPLGGGTGVVNQHFLRELAHVPDMWVDFITSSRTRDRFEQEQLADRIRMFKVPVDNRNIHHSSNRELITYAWHAIRLSRTLIRERKYDLSFAFAGVPAGAVSFALYQSAGLPYLVSLQGPDVPGFEARYNYLYPFLKPFLRVIWGHAAAVTATSNKNRLLALETMPQREIHSIPNAVDCEAFFPSGLEHDSVNVLCVGRLIERKGQQHLLRAFALACAKNPQRALRLTLVGTGDGEPALKRLASELGLEKRVAFLGVVPLEQMPEVYRQADIFVLPSQNEGMSIALLEAMASGLPVIVTDTGGTDELVRAGENGLIAGWGDVEAISSALDRLVNDGASRRNMAALNRQAALGFSWTAFTERHLRLFDSIIAGAGHSVVAASRAAG